jgi:hypothetical protein
MPLQNRVNPFGALIATPERGAWTGNRGVIHNAEKQIIKHHAVKYWITCVLDYKGMRRTVMSKKKWTELFFLDEATAFAAGHRPCGFCRHPDFKKFKKLWIAANGAQYNVTDQTKMDIIDGYIHQERLNKEGTHTRFKAVLNSLPTGVFIALENEKACLWYKGRLFEWSFSGYGEVFNFSENQEVEVLTPYSYVNVFRMGYVPEVHDSVHLKMAVS